jgi:alkylation response protein AidB-like acyl-CoA dehydrogenase
MSMPISAPSPAEAAAEGDTVDSLIVDGALAEFGEEFRGWADANEARLAPLMLPCPEFDERVAVARQMRRVLFDAGWGRCGWPVQFGGLGGSIVHRQLVHEELTRRGWPGPANFEHLEIIAPILVRYGDPDFVAEIFPSFLSGDEAWAQGFSEAEAGSDLASIRTAGHVREAEGETHVVVTGRKLWTSWAVWARRALVLVRTGSPEERHRGLTLLAVDLTEPGIAVHRIRQANGTDELAEVTFDDVRVPLRQVIGGLGNGWQIALTLLGYERGTLAWSRQSHFLARFGQGIAASESADERDLGRMFVDLMGLRSVAAYAVIGEASGGDLGPGAAFVKLLMTRNEQDLYELLARLHGARAGVHPGSADDELLSQEYLFSKIVTIYGGSREMQLTTVARQILGLRG